MMSPESRRREIVNLLNKHDLPLKGTDLAQMFGVSRQVIVQDIAILKAEERLIVSTNKGYKLLEKTGLEKILKVSHSDQKIEEELNIIVDAGGMVKDVFVSHRAYGIIRAELNIKSRRDIKKLIADIEAGISRPLKRLTGDYHYHTIVAECQEILIEIEEGLRNADFIVDGYK